MPTTPPVSVSPDPDTAVESEAPRQAPRQAPTGTEVKLHTRISQIFVDMHVDLRQLEFISPGRYNIFGKPMTVMIK